jgi:hypothetical protein
MYNIYHQFTNIYFIIGFDTVFDRACTLHFFKLFNFTLTLRLIKDLFLL